MVTGLFSKSPNFSQYQERTRILVVTSKHDEYYAMTRRQLVFCVSDLYIKVWRMEIRAARAELQYAGRTDCSSRIIQATEQLTGQKVYNVTVLDAQLNGNRQLVLLVKLVTGGKGADDLHEAFVAYEWAFTFEGIATGKHTHEKSCRTTWPAFANSAVL